MYISKILTEKSMQTRQGLSVHMPKIPTLIISAMMMCTFNAVWSDSRKDIYHTKFLLNESRRYYLPSVHDWFMHHFTKMLQGKMMQSAMISATAVPNVGLMAKEREEHSTCIQEKHGTLYLYLVSLLENRIFCREKLAKFWDQLVF